MSAPGPDDRALTHGVGDAAARAAVRPTSAGMRWMLLAASALVFIVGIQLYILTEHTDRFFAWTIASPLTAAFLGGGYWASFAMELLAARRRVWADARIAVPAVLIFTSLMLLVTLLHLDRFHLYHLSLLTRGAAWAWLLVYAVVPLLMGVLLIEQLRMPSGDPPRTAPLPSGVHGILRIHALIMVVLGLGLLLAPTTVAVVWPWPLTPLTGRAIGAWLLALGVAAAHASWENDWRRVQVATLSYTVFGALQLLALARYPDEMQWSRPAAWLYVLFLLSVLGLGVYGWRRSAQLNAGSDVPVASAAV